MKKIISLTLALLFLIPSGTKSQENPNRKPKIGLAGCAVGAVVIVGGIYIYIKLCKLANRCLPPPPPKTNAPPVSVPGPKHYVNLDPGEALSVYDITAVSSTNSAFNGPDGLPYEKMFVVNLQAGDSPDNFTQTHTITGWISPTFIMTDYNGTRTASAIGDGGSVSVPVVGENKFFRLVK